ncbi:hypothetical protein MMC18_006112 [Xylographa bjoerkii]|nr:hypothetical protein [Xylographa bjoerkii]
MPAPQHPTQRHPPVMPWSLHPEHSAELARQWIAYQRNGPAPSEWAAAAPVRVVRMPAQQPQRVLGLRDQPDIYRWSVPLDRTVGLDGGRGGVVVGERKPLERLNSALPSNPVPRRDMRITEFCGRIQRWGWRRDCERPRQDKERCQPKRQIAAVVSNHGQVHMEWINTTKEDYNVPPKGLRRQPPQPTKLKNSLAYQPQTLNANSRTKAACTAHQPAGKNFMDLPLELRELIYHYIFAGIRWGHAPKKSCSGTKRGSYALAILRLSKDIQTEAHSYFLQRMEWDFVADNRGIDHLEYLATARQASLRNVSRVNLMVEANATRVSGQIGARLGRALCCISSLRHIRVEIQHSRRNYNLVRDESKDEHNKCRDHCFKRYLIGSLEKHLLDVLPPGWVTRKPQRRAPEGQSVFYLRKILSK